MSTFTQGYTEYTETGRRHARDWSSSELAARKKSSNPQSGVQLWCVPGVIGMKSGTGKHGKLLDQFLMWIYDSQIITWIPWI